jgi:hypothetical protein
MESSIVSARSAAEVEWLNRLAKLMICRLEWAYHHTWTCKSILQAAVEQSRYLMREFRLMKGQISFERCSTPYVASVVIIFWLGYLIHHISGDGNSPEFKSSREFSGSENGHRHVFTHE